MWVVGACINAFMLKAFRYRIYVFIGIFLHGHSVMVTVIVKGMLNYVIYLLLFEHMTYNG